MTSSKTLHAILIATKLVMHQLQIYPPLHLRVDLPLLHDSKMWCPLTAPLSDRVEKQSDQQPLPSQKIQC